MAKWFNGLKNNKFIMLNKAIQVKLSSCGGLNRIITFWRSTFTVNWGQRRRFYIHLTEEKAHDSLLMANQAWGRTISRQIWTWHEIERSIRDGEEFLKTNSNCLQHHGKIMCCHLGAWKTRVISESPRKTHSVSSIPSSKGKLSLMTQQTNSKTNWQSV